MAAPASRNNGDLWRISFIEVDSFVCVDGQTRDCNCNTPQRTLNKYHLIDNEVSIYLKISLVVFGVEMGTNNQYFLFGLRSQLVVQHADAAAGCWLALFWRKSINSRIFSIKYKSAETLDQMGSCGGLCTHNAFGRRMAY
jgi:hypothetical protein